MYARINLKSHVTVTRERTPGEWDANDTDTEWYLPDTFRVAESRDQVDHWSEEALPINFQPEKGTDYWLIYAIYSTGDSFHRDYRGGCELIAMCPTKAEAEQNIETLRNTGKEFGAKITVNGTEMDVHVPWNGYFERLEELDIQPLLFRTGN